MHHKVTQLLPAGQGTLEPSLPSRGAVGTGNFSGTVLRTKRLWTHAPPGCDRSLPLQRGGSPPKVQQTKRCSVLKARRRTLRGWRSGLRAGSERSRESQSFKTANGTISIERCTTEVCLPVHPTGGAGGFGCRATGPVEHKGHLTNRTL